MTGSVVYKDVGCLPEWDTVVCRILEDKLHLSVYRKADSPDENSVPGEDISESLAGMFLFSCGSCEYTLDMFRFSSTFCDGACYGLTPEKQGMKFIELEKDRQMPASGIRAAMNGYFIRIFFPDTESLLTECLLCIPRRIAGRDMNLVANTEIVELPQGIPNRNFIMPTLALAGPDSVQKGLPVEVRVSARGAGELESLLWINVDSDNGILPLRRFRLATGEERTVIIQTEGLETGDIIRVTAGIDSLRKLASHTLNIKEGA